MTNVSLMEKPDEGNPHVRFGEGEVASAKPRRGSLLYNNDGDDIVSVIEKLVKIQERGVDAVNILDFARMDENAHTSFLAALLRYQRGRSQVFVHSFLRRMLDIEPQDESYNVDCQVTIENGRRPDMVISSRTLYVGFENKVCGAIDGESQVTDYWKHVVEKSKDCYGYLVYLTLAGGSPANWSLDPALKDKIEQQYCERSYKQDVLDWLREDVLPNCLISERTLAQSVELYVEILERRTGGVANAQVAEKMMQLIPERFRHYAKIGDLGKLFLEVRGRVGDEVVASALQGLETIKNWMVAQCVYCDQYATAYNLKWILKNNPTVRYKHAPKVSLGIFSSISLFTYCGKKHIGCKGSIKGLTVEIHLCCSEGGLIHGPYLLDSIFESGLTDQQLSDAGFVKGERQHPTVYPMKGFDFGKTDLPELAVHIAQMAKKVESLLEVVSKR